MKQKQRRLNPAQQKWLLEVDFYLRANIKNHNVVIADIAYALCMSERNFYRRLEKLAGLTPNQYIQQFRLKCAMELLKDGEVDSVKELAARVGFYHPDYFSRLFEGHYGCRPVEWMHSQEDAL